VSAFLFITSDWRSDLAAAALALAVVVLDYRRTGVEQIANRKDGEKPLITTTNGGTK